MGKHSKLFNSQNDYDSFILSDEFVLPNVSYIVENDTVNFHPYAMDYNSQYLTFEAIEDSTFKLTQTQNDCEYSLDEGETWVSLAAETDTPKVPAGSKIMFKKANPTIGEGIGTFSSTGKFNIEGNIMSMLYGDDFIGQNDLTDKSFAFLGLFGGTNVVEAHNLILPATILSDNCYTAMFAGCSSLTTAPELPATTLAEHCYGAMFGVCSSLTTAPKLPATTLVERCYYSMFAICSSLTSAPELPATTLAISCYSEMFIGCSTLNYIKMLATDISATSCLDYWVDGVASSGTFVKNPNMITLPSGNNGIPNGWTVEDYQE